MIAIVAVTKQGKKIAEKLNSAFTCKTKLYFGPKGALKGLIGNIFDRDKFDGIVFIMALGIVVRLIAPFLKNKYIDPAVVAVDTAGRFAVSVVSGHEGGANKLTMEVGNILCAEPVITTGSEVKKRIIVGIGCRRGIKKSEIIEGIKRALARTRFSLRDVRYIATIDLKRNEPGLKKACLELGISLKIMSTDMVKNFKGEYRRSSFVKGKIGVEGVSEPCALLAARNPKLLLPKIKVGGVTAAVTEEN